VTADGHPVRVRALRATLLAHYDRHRRDLPWRRTRDPYAIWVSEVMLQQTRVETVVPYYLRFLERFPTVASLAEAPAERVHAAWSGLGYYRRARLLHEGARTVVRDCGGVLPSDRKALLALPGIGTYTSGAIASIAFGLPAPAVDGNVERVLTRVFALAGAPEREPTHTRIATIAARLADSDRAGDVNQALMELGATVCTPASPACDRCPWTSECAARSLGQTGRFPERRARATRSVERWTALVATDRAGKHVWLQPGTGARWAGMLLPPMREGRARTVWDGAPRPLPTRTCGSVVHVLTHRSLDVAVVRGTLAGVPQGGELVQLDALHDRPLPAITRRILACAKLAEPSDRHGRARSLRG